MSENGIQSVNAILTEITDLFGAMFDRMEWADDEIAKAQARHPESANKLYHAFKLLNTAHELMGNEMVYRSHCREILDRVTKGQDTRPGTAAEICVMMSQITQRTPVSTAATGLYMRAWKLAGFPGKQFDGLPHYEAIKASEIDNFEAESRKKLANPERTFAAMDNCLGMHHGEKVDCEFARESTLAA